MNLVIFLLIFLKHFNYVSSKKNAIAIAINEIIEGHYVKNSIRFDFIHNLRSHEANETLGYVMRQISAQQPYEVIKVEVVEKSSDPSDWNFKHTPKDTVFTQTQSGIMMFDTLDKYWNYHAVADFERYANFGPIQLNELVYCKNSSEKQILEKFQTESAGTLINFLSYNRSTYQAHTKSFLIEDKSGGDIVLMTPSLSAPSSCGSFKMVELNRFSRKKSKWNSEAFFTPEINNFNGCHLRVKLDTNETPSSYGLCGSGESDVYEGYLVSIVTNLASHLNFTYDFICDGTTRQFDLKLSAKKYNNFYNFYYITTPTLYGFNGILVPPGEPYTPLEKLFLPFDFTTWMLFLLVFLVAYFTVLLVNFFSDRAVKEFFYGENVQTPSINVFLIFMGGGMMVLPRKNFPRFLVMAFILYCLIMR